MSRYTPVAALTDDDRLDGFSCGEESLDDWLSTRAWSNQVAGFSRTYVTTDHKRVVGYYAVSSFSVLRVPATRRAGRRAPQQIPAILLGRLAVDQEHQSQGLGAALLGDAMRVTLAAGEAVGVRMLVLNALHGQAASFYERFGFDRSPTNPLDLMIIVDDIRASL